MGFFKSNDEIPKLPKAPSLLDLPTIDDKRGLIPELPSFPSKNELHEKFNQQMVKSAVSESSGGEEVNSIPEIPYANSYHHEDEEQTKRISEVPQRETVYVKIDKFNNAQKSILEIQTKVNELTKAIDELKKIKTKEIEELSGWDEEMKNINLRLSRIDKGIFGEV